MKIRGIRGMAIRLIAIGGIAAAAMLAIRGITRRKLRYREVPVE
jgi:hypothetical protein